ncbi:alcohol dehydrogenase catalytic domain-containing protein, partial [Candidatus Bathyarchaeota archaeon]|nr:alcohol dehydrogenase catalytic domain-containing protein [Candidatus Bathyarchaeota archaeon]
MKTARLHKTGEGLKIEQVPIPEIKAREVLVEVKASGICGSDLHYRNGISPVGKLPIILGHEISGVIAEKGGEVKHLNVGDRVCVHYLISCGNCLFCRRGLENLCQKALMIGKHLDGGFAQYVKVPAANIIKLPSNVPFEQGAIIGCAVSTAFHALRRSRLREGESVLIYGVGGIGAHAIQLAARIYGASSIIAVDVAEDRLKIAR